MTAGLSRASRSQQLVLHILEQPNLVAQVQALEPAVLTKLVRHVGLEDCGELVALFTVEQLMAVFDEDLWVQARPGDAEEFDDQRFVVWLEVLLESGPELAAQKVAEFDEDLLVSALSRQLLVIDADVLALRMTARGGSDEAELIEKELDGCLYQEFEEHMVLARDERTWEPLRTLLVELDSQHHDKLVRLLERCCHVSLEFIADNGGLYEVLSAGEMVAADVAAEREDRRERRGYVAPAAAASFLSHACVESFTALRESKELDPVTRAHFRAAAGSTPTRAAASSAQRADSAPLLAALHAAGVVETPSALPLLAAGLAPRGTTELGLTLALRHLRDRAGNAYAERLEELAYLANVLLAGCEYQGRVLRPLEAVRGALATAQLGAELLGCAPGASSTAVSQLAERLESTRLVRLFRLGWHAVYHEIVEIAAQALHTRLEASAPRAAAALARARSTGKPWLATAELSRCLGPYDRESRLLLSLMQQVPTPHSRSQTERRSGFIESEAHLRALRDALRVLAPPGSPCVPPSPGRDSGSRGNSK
jgi:hypothetical protein